MMYMKITFQMDLDKFRIQKHMLLMKMVKLLILEDESI